MSIRSDVGKDTRRRRCALASASLGLLAGALALVGGASPPAGADSAGLAARSFLTARLGGPVQLAYIPPLSNFQESPEDWTAFNPDSQEEVPFGIAAPQAGWSPGGLNFRRTPLDPNWTFRAPAKFRGDHSPVYNGSLSFVMLTGGDISDPGDVLLTGGGGVAGGNVTLRRPIDYPTHEGRAYSLPLNENGGWVDAVTGVPPTRAQFKAVLAEITDLDLPTWRHSPLQGLEDWTNLLQLVRYRMPSSGVMVVSPDVLEFGRVKAKAPHHLTRTVIIANHSAMRGDVLKVQLELQGGGPPFSTPHSGDDIEIAPGHHLKQRITFAPRANGDFQDVLHIDSSDQDHLTVLVPVHGTGFGAPPPPP